MTAARSPGLTVGELAAQVGGTLTGPSGAMVSGVNTVAEAGPSEITFISTRDYAGQWPRCKAAAAIVSSNVHIDRSNGDDRPLIRVDDAEIAVIRVLELFQPPPILPEPGVHPSAVVHPQATLGKHVRIAAHVSIDQGAVIGDGVTLFAGVRIYPGAQVGAGSTLHANVVVRENCRIGRGVLLHQGVAIGADGFNYRPDPHGDGVLKVPHLGNVVIEDGVEIGANSCIDRGKFGSTIVGAGTKIDNLCQIAHNCRIGRCCLIAGNSAVAGSTVLEDGVQLGGMVGVIDHLHVGRGSRIGARSTVLRDVPAGATWLGYPADEAQRTLRQWASLRKLPDLLRRLSRRGASDDKA